MLGFIERDAPKSYVKSVAIAGSENDFVNGHFLITLPWVEAAKTRSGTYASALMRPRHLQRKLSRAMSLRLKSPLVAKTLTEGDISEHCR